MKKYLLLMFLIVAMSEFVSAQTIRFVTPLGGLVTKNGTTWATAFDNTQLQTAIDEAGVTEVWVASGTYTPTVDENGVSNPTDLRTKTFHMKDDVAIYGGFAGSETILSQRNWATNVTILSGDIGTPGDNADNSYHVFYHPTLPWITNTAILDGFTIIGGNANDSYPNDSGGGMYNFDSADPTLANCIISGNSAKYGGGVYNEFSSPILTNCTISGNSASVYGGGLDNYSSSPSLTNCLITGNSASNYGGGVYNIYLSPNLTNCTISGNSAVNGGGVYNDDSSSPTLKNSIIWGNTATTNGNQIYISSGTITLSYSCYSNGSRDVIGAPITSSCITSDPKFVNAAGGDYRIYGNSPCVNKGNNGDNSSTYDIRGQARIQNTTIDMGAYEWTTIVDPATANVTWTGTGSTDWNIPANWNLGFVPTATDYITIPNVTNDPVVNNLTIDPGGILTINPRGALTVSSALTNNGTLTLQSDASGTGSLIVGSATGSVTVQRYMTTGVWHQVSPPLAGQTVADFLTATGNITNVATKNTTDRGMMNYITVSNAWSAFYTNLSAGTLAAGQGYMMRTDFNAAVNFTGAITTGTKSISLSGAGDTGWNLIGNPFTSTINLNSGTNDFLTVNSGSLDINNVGVYIWNQALSKYDIFNLTGSDFASVGQAFFVKSKTDGASINYTPAMQAHQNTVALKSGFAYPEIKLIASNDNKNVSTSIKFIDGTSKGLDPGYDAGIFKLDASVSLYTKLVEDNGVQFMMQCLPNSDFSDLIIPVGLDSKTGGQVVFSAETINLSLDCMVILEDKVNKTFTDLSKNVYSTTIEASSSTSGRFFIHTSYLTTGFDNSTLENQLSAYAIRNNEIRVIGKANGGSVATLYDIQGRAIVVKILEDGILNTIPTPNIKTGIYMLSVNDHGKLQGFKIPVKE